MTKTLFFYDLETSGLSARSDRIMQFAGQRTDLDLQPIGEPHNVLVRLNDDTLPSPDALMVTGITPQKTVEEGFSEAEFAKLLVEEVFTPNTVAVGFNNIRFDDEFIRHLLWRNFYDPYEWTWKDGRSRWDLLDVVRMTRALRPEGIEWPVDKTGKATNRLELLTKVNKLDHAAAHDALSDVTALIQVTNLIKNTHPQLYEYLFKIRDKKEVQKLVNLDDKKPFVYSSGRYDSEFAKTTVAFPLTAGRNSAVVVYDLRVDPTDFINLSVSDLNKKMSASWQERQEAGFVKLPVKELQSNRCPAVAPLGVLSASGGWDKIKLDQKLIEKHRNILLGAPHFAENIRSLFQQDPQYAKNTDPESRLYDGFLNDKDRLRVSTVNRLNEKDLADFSPDFSDDRLSPLLLHYKARSFPRTLAESEVMQWEEWRATRLKNQLPEFMKRMSQLSVQHQTNSEKQFILSELNLWAESILPIDSD